MDRLLTKKELAEHWQVTETSIDNWRRDGTLTACKGMPVIRFSPQHIAELEGIKLEKFSPLERKKLERELENRNRIVELRDKEIADLKSRITRMLSIGAEVIYSKES
ncbi:MAG TPA: histidine kinase [Clostridium sp.]